MSNRPVKSRHGKNRVAKPGEPFCANCQVAGHLIKDCWSPGGGSEGQGSRNKKANTRKPTKSKNEKGKKHRANRVKDKSSEPESDDGGESHISAYVAATGKSSSRFSFILDSAATTHICKIRSAFTSFTPRTSTIDGIDETEQGLAVLGHGDVNVIVSIAGQNDRMITLRNVAYAPKARDNLISESRMDKRGLGIWRKSGTVQVLKLDGSIVMEGHLQKDNLYHLKCAIAPSSFKPSDVAFLSSSTFNPNLEMWHRRTGHISEDALRYMIRHDMVTGLKIKPGGSLGPCDGCAKGKFSRSPFLISKNRSKHVLDWLHMDLQGPFTRSIAGYTYTLAVVDDNTQMGWKEYLKNKSDAADEIKALIICLETQTERRVKIV
jgi:hypothetical protein